MPTPTAQSQLQQLPLLLSYSSTAPLRSTAGEGSAACTPPGSYFSYTAATAAPSARQLPARHRRVPEAQGNGASGWGTARRPRIPRCRAVPHRPYRGYSSARNHSHTAFGTATLQYNTFSAGPRTYAAARKETCTGLVFIRLVQIQAGSTDTQDTASKTCTIRAPCVPAQQPRTCSHTYMERDCCLSTMEAKSR